MGGTQSSVENVVSDGKKTGKTDWFQKTRHLGSGCFADVYCCRLGKDLPHIALKILDKKKIGVKELSALNDCMNSLEGKKIHHENVIEYYGKFVLDDKIYIFMEYMKYGSLKYLYESLGKGINDQIVGIYTKQILVGLNYLHQTHNIIHRDLKCDNVLLCGPLTVKICDLEFCKGLSKTEAYVDEKCGTGVFMAPEVNANRGYTYSADIWSLGVTVLEMKLGKVPDQINNLLNEDKPFAYYEGESTNLSGNIMQILSACLVLEPEKRADIATLLKLEICMVNTINTREIENILMHMKAKTDTDDDLREITNQQIQNTCFDHFLIEIKKESSNGAETVSREAHSNSVSEKAVSISLSENECFIGKGLFGETNCVQLRDGQGFAALKKINTNKLTDIKRKQLIKLFEYFRLTSLSHDYVIHFYQSISTPDQFRIYQRL